MAEHHLSSLVVHAKPDKLEYVAADLVREGCEVHAQSSAGKLVVTLEAEHQSDISDTITRIQLLPGVIAATLVFHHSEEAPMEETAS